MISSLKSFFERSSFLVWVGVMLAVGFLAVSTVSYITSRDSIRKRISDHALPLTADNVYSQIQKDLLNPVFIASLMAHDTFVRDWILDGERDPQRIARYLGEISRKYGTVISFLATEHSRTYYHQGGVLRQIEESGERDQWFFRGRAMQTEYETNVDPDELDRHTLTVYINHRVLDFRGNFIGMTGVGLRLESVGRLIDSYENQFRRRIFFVDRQGRVVLGGKSTSVKSGSIRDWPGIGAISEQILAGQEQSAALQSSYRGERSLVLVNSRFIPELGWHLVVEEDEGEEIDAVLRIFRFNLVLSLVISALTLAIMRHLTNRYQSRVGALVEEALRHANREMEHAREQQEFVAMVSHEFRTPLAVIDTALQSLHRLENVLPDDVTARHRKMHRASHRLQELIDNYLTGDRIAQKGFVPVREDIDLVALINQMARRVQWPALRMDLPRDDATASAPHVWGDRELLGIALLNLLSNAAKYSPPAGEIHVSCHVADGFAVVSIADHGPGIAVGEQPLIFNKYHRIAGNQTRGAGLGLYLVKRIIDLHGGTITVSSTPGAGTCMTVSLPLNN